jgi:hypothetical protein
MIVVYVLLGVASILGWVAYASAGDNWRGK